MDELANRTVALDDVLGSWARELVERMGAGSCWEDRFATVNHMLTARLAESVPPDPALVWSLGRLTASGGTASIGGLADELEWSHRRLIARFRDADLDWASAAAACGFADQAHMAREVRDLSGLTPSALHAEKVNFVQDSDTVAA